MFVFLYLSAVTDDTLKRQEELIRTLQNRAEALESEKKELHEINNQLHVDINQLKKMRSRDDGTKTLFKLTCSQIKHIRSST